MEDVKKNKFFKKARDRAVEIIKNNDRLKNLIQTTGNKLKGLNSEQLKNTRFVQRIKVISRMIKAYAKGQYRNIEWQNIVLLVAALVYFVTPIDLVPDFIPVTGFIDDFAVIVWVYNRLQTEIDKFIAWEKEHTISI